MHRLAKPRPRHDTEAGDVRLVAVEFVRDPDQRATADHVIRRSQRGLGQLEQARDLRRIAPSAKTNSLSSVKKEYGRTPPVVSDIATSSRPAMCSSTTVEAPGMSSQARRTASAIVRIGAGSIAPG